MAETVVRQEVRLAELVGQTTDAELAARVAAELASDRAVTAAGITIGVGDAVATDRRAILAAADVGPRLGADDAESIVLAVRERLDRVLVLGRDAHEGIAHRDRDRRVAGGAEALERGPELLRHERHVVDGVLLISGPLVTEAVVLVLA